MFTGGGTGRETQPRLISGKGCADGHFMGIERYGVLQDTRVEETGKKLGKSLSIGCQVLQDISKLSLLLANSSEEGI